MENYYVKVDYIKIRAGGIVLPVYHTAIEVHAGKKTFRWGFKADFKNHWFWSIFFPIHGHVRKERFDAESEIIVTRSKKKVERLLKLLKKHNWKKYHLFFHNCFKWRDSLLKDAGIKIPKDGYWDPAGD